MQKSKIKNQNDNSKFKNVPTKSGYPNFAFCILHFAFKQGFTLLEMIVSIGIFTMLVIASIGITLGVSNAQLKAANTQAVIDNVRFSLELITKEMRTGAEYQLSADCGVLGSEIQFINSDGYRLYYILDSTPGVIKRAKLAPLSSNPLVVAPPLSSANCEANMRQFTSDEVIIERLNFQLTGALPGPNDGQPRITITVRARSRDTKVEFASSMDLQTTVVQRLRDL